MELKISPFAFKSAEEPNIDVVKEVKKVEGGGRVLKTFTLTPFLSSK